MKTLDNIQNDLATAQAGISKVVLLLRIGSLVGELFGSSNDRARADLIGHLALAVCQLCSNEGITVPSGARGPAKSDLDLSQDAIAGIVLWMGRMYQLQEQATTATVSGALTFSRDGYEVQFRCGVAHFLAYLDRFAREANRHNNLLVLANMAHQGNPE